MTIYGRDYYGQDPNNAYVYYGLTFPGQAQPSSTVTTAVKPQYNVDPFVANSVDYNHILLNWTQPAVAGWSDFRLLSNRYGFPVDENDGVLLLDAGGSTWPGSSYLDSNVIPGTYHHYGIYLLVNDTTVSTTNVTISPPLNQTQSTWANGVGQAYISTNGGTATVTNNIPNGAPYPYGIKYVAPAGGTGTCSFPFNAPVAVAVSTVYTVTAWVYSPTGKVIMGMDWETGADSQVSNTVNTITVPVNKWTQVSTQVTSPGSGVTLGSAIFYGTSDAGQCAYTIFATGITIQQGVASTITATQSQGVWVRAGLAACLAPTNFNTTQFLINTIPEYFKQGITGDLTTDESGNLFLEQYLSVIAWSVDYLKTALVVAQNVNNPDIIPVNDLYNLALTLGFPFEPEISAGVIRMGLKNVAQLVQQRGTLEGIAAYATNLAGMAIDLQVGYNLMLDDNTSNFKYPQSLGIWDATKSYQIGDIVDYQKYKYISNVVNNVNNTPTGTTSNNASWNAMYYTSTANSPGYITNPVTNWPSSYEPRWASSSHQFPNDVTALRESVGILDPLDTTQYHSKGLKIRNNSGGSTTIDLRSVSRTPADFTALNDQPDAQQVINDGVPVPYTLPSQVWSSTTAYQTGQIVSYQGLPFVALKASTNVAPPSNYTPSNEWQQIGYDSRVQLMTSAYTSADFSNVSQYNIQPYVAMYDQNGLHVADLLPRNPSFQTLDANMATTSNQAFVHTSGTVLTASANGVTSIDGVFVSLIGQTVLLAGQTSALDNGYYTVTTVGTSLVKTVLTRYTTGVLPAANYPDSYVYVEAGTVNAGATYYCTNTSTPTLGTTALTFSTTAPVGSFYPTNLVFDSFAKPSDWGNNVTTHNPEVGLSSGSQFTYTANVNNFKLNAFASGVVVPSNLGAQCMATINYGQANAMLGITLVTTPTGFGYTMGIVGRVASATSYIRIDQNGIIQNNAGVFTVLATHSTAANAGDRITALFNGNVITAYINGIQVSTVTTSFNNTQTVFGYTYEPAYSISGRTQPRTTVTWSRRPAKRGRSFSQSIKGSPKFGGNGATQPWTTRPVPRRLTARSYIQRSTNPYSYYTSGQLQPRTAQPNQRSKAQMHRAFISFKAVVTTNRYFGTVQPDSTVMLPRRKSTRAYIQHSSNVFSFHVLGTSQPRPTLANQRSVTQRHRAVLGSVPQYGLAKVKVQAPVEHGLVVQRPATRRTRAVTSGRYAQAGTPRFGPSGTTQHQIAVSQRSLAQRSRAHVGNQSFSADTEEVFSYHTSGQTQPRATVPTPRRTSTRAKIGNVSAPFGEEIGRPAFGPSGLQPLSAKPVQRVLKQRGRAIVKVSAVFESSGPQTRGPSGTVQSLQTKPARRRTARAVAGGHVTFSYFTNGKTQPVATRQLPRRAKARAVVGNNNMCGDGNPIANPRQFGKTQPIATTGGVVTRRPRAPHRRTGRNG
jgi:hypothetical protein